jgi:insertion element IS1 protein InsB
MPENHAQNQINAPSCYRCVAKCPYCEHGAKKYGFTLGGKQRFRCKKCFRTFIDVYNQKLSVEHIDNKIKVLLKEGCGIRSIGRILKISAVTVVRKIRTIASYIKMHQKQ